MITLATPYAAFVLAESLHELPLRQRGAVGGGDRDRQRRGQWDHAPRALGED